MAGECYDTRRGETVSYWQQQTVATRVQCLLPSTSRGHKAADSGKDRAAQGCLRLLEGQHYKAPTNTPRATQTCADRDSPWLPSSSRRPAL